MDNSITPEQSILLCMATLYIAMTEAIAETFGKSVEPATNRIIEGLLPLLPEEAADMCSYLLEFATSHNARPDSQIDWLAHLGSSSIH